MLNLVCFRTARRLADICLQVVVTSEPSEISLLWYLWYIRCCHGSIKIMSTTNGGQVRVSKVEGQDMRFRH